MSQIAVNLQEKLPKTSQIASIEEVILELKKGKMIIVVDDEDRENEGDLIIPAENATPEMISFMAKNGCGLICLSLTQEKINQLELPLMSRQNQSRHQTAFTVSIEARQGISTGISAYDRSKTIQTAIDEKSTRNDIATPGHVFPLVAKDGGVLVRAGHTEASVDLARLAGFKPAGVICEIMNDDGTMARLPDLFEFATQHDLKIAKIADLIAYRRKYDHLVEAQLKQSFMSDYGGKFNLTSYKNKIAPHSHYISLVKGDISNSKSDPVYVRMHRLSVSQDVLGNQSTQSKLRQAMEFIADKDRGVIVLIQDDEASMISSAINDNNHDNQIRNYGIGAQILYDLGLKKIILLTNSDKLVVGIDGFDIEIVGTHKLEK